MPMLSFSWIEEKASKMNILSHAFVHSCIVFESKKLSYGNFMFLDNLRCLYYPDEESEAVEEPADDDERSKLFQRGLELDQAGDRTEALKCYLKCLVGLKENSRFALLPQCLRNVCMHQLWWLQLDAYSDISVLSYQSILRHCLTFLYD